MNSKYEEAKEASKQNLEETQDIPTMVCVQEHNWLALISDVSEDEAVAVRTPDTYEYYLFRNMDYKKEDDIS